MLPETTAKATDYALSPRHSPDQRFGLRGSPRLKPALQCPKLAFLELFRLVLPDSKRVDVKGDRAKNLHDQSKQRASTWTNTLEGGRKAQLRVLQQAAEKEEIGLI